MRHATDPAHLHDAAANMGLAVAEGRVSHADMLTVFRQMAQVHTGSEISGLQARLCWTAADTANDHAKALWAAEDRLRDKVRPMIAIRAAKHEIEEVAGGFADPLGWDRIFKILREEVSRARFRNRWR